MQSAVSVQKMKRNTLKYNLIDVKNTSIDTFNCIVHKHTLETVIFLLGGAKHNSVEKRSL